MGKFDDNRYVAEMKQKFEQISPDTINQAHVEGAYEAFKEVMDADVDEVDYKRVQAGYGRITPDEQIAVFKLFGKEKPEGSRKQYTSILKELISMTEADLDNPDNREIIQ